MVNKCIVCGCTDGNACRDEESGETCHWVNDEHTLCSGCDGTATQSVPVYLESLGGSLIDAARISVMGALVLLREQKSVIVTVDAAGQESEMPTVEDCLREGLSWLDAARRMTIERMPAPPTSPTSLHVLRTDTPNGIS